MPSLSDIIGDAGRQMKNSTQAVNNTAKTAAPRAASIIARDASSVARTAVENTVGKATNGVSSAINAGVSGVTGAAGALMRGDVGGAINQIAGTPSAIMGKLSQAFGGLTGGSTLKGPSLPFGNTMGTSDLVKPTLDNRQRGNGQGTTAAALSAGNSLAGALARTDPMLSFNWYAEMPVITPLGGGAAKDLPWYFVEEATVPFRTYDVRSVFREGRDKHYPSKYSVDSLRLAIYADTANVALNYLIAWNGAILLPTTVKTAAKQGGGWGTASGYKKTIKINLVNPAKKTLATLEYVEAWPQTVDSIQLESGSSTRVVLHVTFSVGDVFPTLYEVASTSTNTFMTDGSSSGTPVADRIRADSIQTSALDSKYPSTAGLNFGAGLPGNIA